jgi:hypothetical protein
MSTWTEFHLASASPWEWKSLAWRPHSISADSRVESGLFLKRDIGNARADRKSLKYLSRPHVFMDHKSEPLPMPIQLLAGPWKSGQSASSAIAT